MPMFLEGQDPRDATPAQRAPIGSPSPDPFAGAPPLAEKGDDLPELAAAIIDDVERLADTVDA